ncbi:ABC-type transporter, integral membrane subunit [Tepidanaerobacter acetatoxydans Re1]|uniref:ABC-type transporter, integral membrane subunit n=1 Tax=Tepidanaerobacter acetatoxydans (strain DSM 21804 / JCM 16047 / Re1) TaxID=1209989 RepID=F4LWY8_TEPAE|nr:ABC transporter permease [Tepidanaerobacter acetatoxydans]AEE90966.1 ABC-type transporter, integral membrane subunit [Tepidanaerobacter acetatoxydans Re1]CCP25560.1 ABC-type transporter, integral membrane subunit [Tepidanaerobacter acetatoxydans Re1]
MYNTKINNLEDKIDESLFVFAEYDESEAERIGYSNYSYWRSTFQVFRKNKVAMFFLKIIIVLLAFTIIQPYLPNQKSPTKIYLDPNTNMQLRNQPPNIEFWFGTNSIGQDLWSRIWSGTRTSLFIGLLVAIWDAIIGITVGALWGYVRRLDALITEIYNVMDNIPTTIIQVLFAYILRPSIKTLVFAMCITGWLGTARFIRNQIVIIRDREYNLASRCLGTPTKRIITRNLLPYLISVIMLRMALAIPTAIGSEVFLTYIGLGLPVSIPSLGNLVNEGRLVMMVSSLRYQLIFPAIVLSLITISFYIIGNAFADAADPKTHV